MKTKIKRHSRSVISVLLAVCMLVSCMTAGMIMTDAAKVDGESVGASETMTVYFRDNYSWGSVYAFSGNDMNVTNNDGFGYDVWGSGLDSGWVTMTKVAGTTNIFKANLTVYDGKVAFAKSPNTQSTYFNDCGGYVAVTPSGMTNGKLLNIWNGANDEVGNKNGISYRKYNLDDYTEPNYYIHWGTDDNFSGYSHHVELTQNASDNTKYEATYSVTGNCFLVINNSSSSGATSLLNSSTIVNKDGEGLGDTWWCDTIKNQGTTYLVKFGTNDNRTGTVSVVYDTDGNTVDVNMNVDAVSSSMYIIGDRALGNGIGWTSGDARKEMTQSGEDYTYTSVEIPADSVCGFRLTNSSTGWGTNYGSTKLVSVDDDYIKVEAGASDNNIKVCPPRKNRQKTYAKNRMKRMTNII